MADVKVFNFQFGASIMEFTQQMPDRSASIKNSIFWESVNWSSFLNLIYGKFIYLPIYNTKYNRILESFGTRTQISSQNEIPLIPQILNNKSF